MHLKWNHSTGQPGLSQAIILPDCEPPQDTRIIPSGYVICLADFCLLLAAALQAPACRRFLTE